MPRLVLHIGTEKTGTTSLQNFFATNREALKGVGICYPETLGATNHIKLPVAAISNDNWDMYIRNICGVSSLFELKSFRKMLRLQLMDEVSGYDTVVVSSEHLAGALTADEDVVWLGNFLRDVFSEIKVVVYLRRQDLFFTSMYSTQIRLGAKHILIYPSAEMIERKYNYRFLLERWSKVFPAIHVRRFGSGLLKNGSVVDDFVETAGLSLPDDLSRTTFENEALGADQAEFLRNVNMRIPFREGGKLSGKRGDIDRLVDLVPQTGGRVRMRPAMAARLMKEVSESNHWVSETYFGGACKRGDPLFGEIQYDNLDVRPMLSAESSLKIASDLLRVAQDEACKSDVECLYDMFAAWWVARVTSGR